MRTAFGLILGAGFLVTGATVLIAAIQIAMTKGMVDDVLALLTICSMLLLVGGVIITIAFRSRKRRTKDEHEQMSTVVLAHLVGNGSDESATGD
ncbi:MAG: hypothetical protein ABJH63_02190 [Rhizobiaceae bacterium]